MGIRVSVLSENIAGADGIMGEFGWSALIEVDGQKILFDTGPGISAWYNAGRMGIELGQVNKIVLSHSHHDHTGGLREILRCMPGKEVDVIAHPHIWAMRYNRKDDKDKYMGMPFRRQELESMGACFKLVTRPLKLSENAMTSGEVAMTIGFENESVPAFGGKGRYMIDGSEIKADAILDDMAIIVKTEDGLVVVLGCAHRGVINTIYHALNITGVEKIHAVLGGAHLISESGGRIEKTIAALKEFDGIKLGLCHCTGLKAITRMAQAFGERFFFCNAGTTHELP